jgi:hypothetical protein
MNFNKRQSMHIIYTKSRGFCQTPQDIMEEYNGCSVPQHAAYPLDMTSNPEFWPQSSEFLLSRGINLTLVILFFQISIDVS